jgi:RHS repeat-associated protein
MILGTTANDGQRHDNGGRMTSSSYHNGVSESRTYNNDNTVASISFTGAAIGNLGYTWDANLNKTSETIGGVMSGYGFTAGYDDEDRLVSWDRADNTLDQAWNLSPVGDWNSITQNSTVQNRTHGPVHELLTAAGESLTYDAKGNMTLIPLSLRPGSDPLTMSWDFNNKLRGADTDDDGIEDVFYIWDALGRRVGRTANSATTIYFQDGQQTLADYASGASASSPTYIYLFASYIDEVVLRSGGSGLVYYHRNQQYSITALTDASGAIVERYAYTAYGQPTFADGSGTAISSSAEGNRHTYTGREWDEGLSLYHYRARMYDAVAGKFCSRDPIGYEGNRWNVYEFANGSPCVYVDYSGNIAIALPVLIPAGIGIAALKAAALSAGVSLFACLMMPDCLGDAKDRTLDEIEGSIDDLVTYIRPRPRPKPDPLIDPPYFPPLPPVDRDCDEPDNCHSKYPDGYDSCDRFPYSSEQEAADATWGRGVTLRSNRTAHSCENGIGTHHNAYRGGQHLGSVLCCDCCDDSLPGLPSDDFGCKTQ